MKKDDTCWLFINKVFGATLLSLGLLAMTPSAAASKMSADVSQVIFVKRLTYSANHYYTEYVNSAWPPPGSRRVPRSWPRPTPRCSPSSRTRSCCR